MYTIIYKIKIVPTMKEGRKGAMKDKLNKVIYEHHI